MAIAFSVLLIAVGAILVWAVDYTISGFELSTAGVIAMVVGAIGLLAALIAYWGPRRDAYVDRLER